MFFLENSIYIYIYMTMGLACERDITWYKDCEK